MSTNYQMLIGKFALNFFMNSVALVLEKCLLIIILFDFFPTVFNALAMRCNQLLFVFL